jgi:beta-lactam-binding protein with PASTA domain
MITRAHCRVGRVRRATSPKPRGRIVKQSPRWGVKRARGARVNLIVSRGKR